jgi:integrase
MPPQPNRRSYGTGSLYIHTDATGRESWYGRWRAGGERIKRCIGPKREPGSRAGLTRAQAEHELRQLMESEQPLPSGSQVSVADAANRHVAHLEALGRKPSTLVSYRALVATHLIPQLGDKPLDGVTPEHVEQFVAAMSRAGKRPRTIRNALTLLHGVFAFGQRKGWCLANPCKGVDRPQIDESGEIHFLELDEVEALLRAVPEDGFASTDRALYLTATMSGLRQGELLALRWRDVDWTAGRIRVRQNYVRGHLGTPKSRRGSRSVPLADRVAAELDCHFQRSAYQGDDDLVFAHPHTGQFLDHSDLGRRFKKSLRAAGVRKVRFHDLRHTFGTKMAASGVPLRTLQEWLGHRDFTTTLIYADYQPSAHEGEMLERAFRGPIRGPNLSETQMNSEGLAGHEQA